MPHRHTLEPLASAHGYTVHICRDCEVVHLEVGPVTLRLRPGALDCLADVLTQASRTLHQPEPVAARPLDALVN